MSAETTKKAYRYTCNMVRPQMYSEKSLMESVVDFFSDVVPQAYTGAQKNEDKEKIQWVKFENCDCNDVSKNPDMFRSETKGMPLILILGYSNGVQIWHVTPNGEAQEVVSLRQGPVRICSVLPNPDPVLGHGDGYSNQRPLIALCDSSSAGQPYCAVKFVSLKTGDEVHAISYKNLPVQSIECNKRFFLTVFLEKVCVYEACQFQQLFWITSCFPCPGPNVNPVALSTRWLAYADKRLVAMHQSCGGMSGDGSQSYAATVISAAKGAFKGLSMFGEAMVSSVTGCKPSPSRRDHQPLDNANRPGIVTVVDLQNIHNDHFNVNEDNEGDGLIAHFHAHANEPVACMAFDPTGTLLVTACKLGHNFHVFRLMAHPVSSALGAVHHLYTLHRGDTTAKVIDISFNHDSRWITVSSHRGTTHLFPITPYGGPVNIRTHCKPHVVNRASRFHKSAGLEEFDHTVGRRSPVLSSSPGSSGQYDRYPSLIQQNTLNNNMGNPRLPPYPHPITIYPAYQIKQPLNVALNPGNKNQSPVHSAARSDNVYSVCAKFCTPRLCVVGSPKLERRDGGKRPVDSLFVMAQSGTVVEYVLDPRAKSVSDKVTDDCLLELNVTGRMQWNVQRLKNSPELRPPLPSNSPLILAHEAIVSQTPTALELYDMPGLTRHDSKDSLSSDHSSKDDSDDQWLSQVEIVTHAGPHRRLWMGPQFSFKTYQENTTVLSSNSSSLLSQSPESNMVAMDMLGDETDLESLKLQPMRSNPVSMPNARPAYRRLSGSDSSPSTGQGVGAQSVPLLIEAGSFEQSPQLLDVFSTWTESSVAKQPRGPEDLEEDRLKETLADAMVESPCKDIEKLSLRNQDNPRASVKSGEKRTQLDKKSAVVKDMNSGPEKKQEDMKPKFTVVKEISSDKRGLADSRKENEEVVKSKSIAEKETNGKKPEKDEKEEKGDMKSDCGEKFEEKSTLSLSDTCRKDKSVTVHKEDLDGKQSKTENSVKSKKQKQEKKKNGKGNRASKGEDSKADCEALEKKDVKSVSSESVNETVILSARKIETEASNLKAEVSNPASAVALHESQSAVSSQETTTDSLHESLSSETAKISCAKVIAYADKENATSEKANIKSDKKMVSEKDRLKNSYESENRIADAVGDSTKLTLDKTCGETNSEKKISGKNVVEKRLKENSITSPACNKSAVEKKVAKNEEQAETFTLSDATTQEKTSGSCGKPANEDELKQPVGKSKEKSKRKNGKKEKNPVDTDGKDKSVSESSDVKNTNITKSHLQKFELYENLDSALDRRDKKTSQPKDQRETNESDRTVEMKAGNFESEDDMSGSVFTPVKNKRREKRSKEMVEDEGKEGKITLKTAVTTDVDSSIHSAGVDCVRESKENLKKYEESEVVSEVKRETKEESPKHHVGKESAISISSAAEDNCEAIVQMSETDAGLEKSEGNNFEVVSKRKKKKKKNGMDESLLGQNNSSLTENLEKTPPEDKYCLDSNNVKLESIALNQSTNCNNQLNDTEKETARESVDSKCIEDDFPVLREEESSDTEIITKGDKSQKKSGNKHAAEKGKETSEEMFIVQKKKHKGKRNKGNSDVNSGRLSTERESLNVTEQAKDSMSSDYDIVVQGTAELSGTDKMGEINNCKQRDVKEKETEAVTGELIQEFDTTDVPRTTADNEMAVIKDDDADIIVIDENDIKKMEDSTESGSKYETAESAEDDPSAWERAEFVECLEDTPSADTVCKSRSYLSNQSDEKAASAKGRDFPLREGDSEKVELRCGKEKEAGKTEIVASTMQMSFFDDSAGSSSRSSEERETNNGDKDTGQKSESKTKKKRKKNRK